MATARAATAAAPSAVQAQRRLAVRPASPLVAASASRPAAWCRAGPRSRQQAQVQCVAEAQRSMDAIFQSSKLKYK